MTNAETRHRHASVMWRFVLSATRQKKLQVSFVCIPHGVLSVNLLFFARIYSTVVTASDEANGHVRPSSSRWFVECGLDRVRWLGLILGLCRCVDELESK